MNNLHFEILHWGYVQEERWTSLAYRTQTQYSYMKTMQGQALNVIRPHDTNILQSIQLCTSTQKYWYPHLAYKKRNMRVSWCFILLHLSFDCNKLSVIFDNDNDIEQNVHEILYDTCTCINKTSVTWKTDHGFKNYIHPDTIFVAWWIFTFYYQLLLIIKIIIHIH